MTRFEANQLYSKKQQNLLRRRDLIKQIRRKAGWYQFFALLFLAGGLFLEVWMRIHKIESVLYIGIAIVLLFFGISFQVASVINFGKAKKHLSGQTVNASTNPKNWV